MVNLYFLLLFCKTKNKKKNSKNILMNEKIIDLEKIDLVYYLVLTTENYIRLENFSRFKTISWKYFKSIR